MRTQHEAANFGFSFLLWIRSLECSILHKKETHSCTLFWCLLNLICTCSIEAKAVKPFPLPTLSCQSTRPCISDLAAEMHSEDTGNKTVDVNAKLYQQEFWRDCWTYVCTHVKKSSCVVFKIVSHDATQIWSMEIKPNLRQQTFWRSKQLWQCLDMHSHGLYSTSLSSVKLPGPSMCKWRPGRTQVVALYRQA